MIIVCGICLEEVDENSCLVAMARCGHIFDKICIDLALNNGIAQCPNCNSRVATWPGEVQYHRLYPSKSESLDTKECINLKKKLAEANQKIATLQLDLSDTKSTLNSSRQQQNTTSQQLKEVKTSLENSTKSAEKLRKDVEHLKRAKDECFKRNDKLKNTNQTLIGNLKISENLCQALREELASSNASSDSQGVLGGMATGASNIQASQISQKDYLDLKKSYQDLVIRERLVEKKLIDFTLQQQQQGSSYTENLEHTQRLYKQLTDALSNEKKLSSTVNQLKHEKKDIVNEKKGLQERFNVASKDLKRLQEAETLWTTNTLHLQDIIKKGEQDISDLQKSKQELIAEIRKLKEKVKSWADHVAALNNNRDMLKRTTDAEKENLRKIITTWKDKATASGSAERTLTSEVFQLTDKIKNLKRSEQGLHIENNRLLKELKAARQPWFSFSGTN